MTDSPQGHPLATIFAVAIILLTVVLSGIFLSENTLTSDIIIGWLACTVVMVAAMFTQSRIKWMGYAALSGLVALFGLGAGPALLALVIGTGIAYALHVTLENTHPSPRIQSLTEPITAVGGGLAIAALLYGLFETLTPLTDANLVIEAAGLAIISAAVTIQGITYVLSQNNPAIKPVWASENRTQAWSVILLPQLAVVPLALVYGDSGAVPFGFIMVMIAGYLLSEGMNVPTAAPKSAAITPVTATPPPTDVSLLPSTGNTSGNEPMIESVLQNTHRWVQQHTNAAMFYVGIYDRHREIVEFPLVVRKGEQISWSPRAVESDRFIQQIISGRHTVSASRSQAEDYSTVFTDLPDTPDYQTAVGVPLAVNTKVIGLMTLINGKNAALNVAALESVAAQAGLAIRNANLYDRNTRLAKNLNLINRSVQDVMFNLDGSSAMAAACETAMKISGADGAAIFLIDTNSRDKMRLAQSRGLIEAHVALYDDPNCLPIQHIDDPRIIPDFSAHIDDPTLAQYAKASEFTAMAETIMRSGNTTIGLLAVFHQDPHHYDMAQLELLETLAYQVSAALDNAELLGALEVYASEQAQLVHLSSISTTSLNLATVIERVTVMLQQMLSVDQAKIGLRLPQKNMIELHSPQETQILNLSKIPELAGLYQQKNPGTYIYYNDDTTISHALDTIMEANNTTTLGVLPMVADNRTIGMIMLEVAEMRYFSDSEWRFVEMATNQIATQIHNAQLYKETEDALSRRLQQLTLIEEIAGQISESLDLEMLFHNVLNAGLQATQASVAVLALTGDKGYRIIGIEELIDGQRHFQRNTPTLPGLMRQVMTAGDLLNVPDNTAEINYETPDYSRGYASSLILPLLSDGVTIGILNLESDQPNYFNDERIKFAKNLAGHAVISIQNARMLEARQSQIDMLTELRGLSIELSTQVEKEPVFRGLLRTALSVLDGYQAALYRVQDDQIYLVTSVVRVGESMAPAPVTIPRAVINEAIHTGELHTYPNVATHDLFKDADIAEQIDYGALLVTPINHGGQISEVLCITREHVTTSLSLERDRAELLTIQVSGHLENVQLYEQIRSNNNQMRAILDSTRDSIILLDAQGRLIDANISAESLLNISIEDYLYLDFAELIMSIANSESQADIADKGLMRLARDLRLQSQNINRHAFQLRVGGQIHYIESVGSPVMESPNDMMGRLLTLRDVTEERRLAEWREEVSHMLVHDLREPLSSVIGSVHFALDILKEGSDDYGIEPLLDVSLDSAEKLYALVQNILDIYKMENDRLPLDRKPSSIIDIAADAVRSLSGSTAEGGLTITEDIPDNTPMLFIDPNLIERVMRNLVGNAIRYAFQGGNILVQSEITPDNTMVLIRVANEGNPIPPEHADAIFEKFRQVEGDDGAPQRGHKGSGVGLAFCKRAVEAHSGKIWLEQQSPLSGASFAITLPILTDADIKDDAAPNTE